MRTSSFLIFLIAAILVAGFIGALAYFTFQPPTAAPKEPISEASEIAPNIAPTRPVIASSDPIRGDPAASLAIVEFGDLLCPPCAEIETALGSVLKQYKGKIKLVWKDLPNTRLHPLAQKAAEAARCAGIQGKFWEYHDVLLQQTNQGQSVTESGLSLVARELNLNMGTFQECLDDGQMSGVVERSLKEGLLLRVDATPYFFIGNRRISGTISQEELETILTSANTL